MWESFSRALALLVTNAIKLAGLYVGVRTAVTTEKPLVLAFAAFMMAGAQVSEKAVLSLIEKLFGVKQP